MLVGRSRGIALLGCLSAPQREVGGSIAQGPPLGGLCRRREVDDQALKDRPLAVCWLRIVRLAAAARKDH